MIADAAYHVTIDRRQLTALVARTMGPFSDSGPIADAMGQVVRKWALMVQTRAVHNVSGYPVIYQGGAFRVQVRTGTLKGSIEMQWPYQHRLQARVFVNGTMTNPGERGGRPTPVSAYAFRIEFGGDEIDLKKTMQGKVVPFFGARSSNARGPYAARGLKPLQEGQTAYGSLWKSDALNAKLAAKGKGPMAFEKRGGKQAYKDPHGSGSTYFISFRRVGKTGWIIPAAKPRPFMRAAIEGTGEAARRMGVREITRVLGVGPQ